MQNVASESPGGAILTGGAVILSLLFRQIADTLSPCGGRGLFLQAFGLSALRAKTLDAEGVMSFECDLSAWSGLDPIYLDGKAGAINLGENVMICYYRWAPIMQQSGLIVRQRIPALCTVRPMASVSPNGGIAKMLMGQKPPRDAGELVH